MAQTPAVRPSHPRAVAASLLVALATAAAVRGAPPALADRASAAAALPAGGQPFLLVVRSPWSADAWDDVPRRPEVAVYPDGQLLVTKSDDRLWAGVLPREELLDLMDFLASDVQMASLAMTYFVTSPVTTFTTYTFTTRAGTSSVRRRASGGFGTNVKPVEAQLDRVDQRLRSLADRADRPYAPGRLLVVSRPVVADPQLPVWAWNAAVPFAALGDATDLATRRGAILADDDARLVRDAVEQSAAWRFGERALEMRLRPALPHELALDVWRNPAMKPAPAPSSPSASPPVAAGPAPVPPGAPVPPAAAPLVPAPPVPAPLAPEPPPVGPAAPATTASGDDGAAAGPAVPAPAVPVLPPPSVPVAPAPVPVPVPPTGPGPAAAASDWRDDDVDYAGVQKILADLKRKTSGSPHAEFWKKDHEAFVAYEFVLQTVEGKVKLLTPGDGAGSNLVRALRGAPLLVVKPDGSVKEEAFSVMPPKGAPMKPADIERIQRWIDHGAPKTRPDGAGAPKAPADAAPPAAPPTDATPAPVPPGPAAPDATAEAKVVSQVALSIVGADAVKLGTRAATEDATAAPRLFVACDAAAWERIFTDLLPSSGGPHGATVAARLATVRAAVKGYDWNGSPLLLVVGPASDNYAWEVGTAVDILADGTGRIALTHRHDERTYATAPEIVVAWALYRADTTGCPRRLVLKTPATVVRATGAEAR